MNARPKKTLAEAIAARDARRAEIQKEKEETEA